MSNEEKKWIEALGTCFCPYGVCGTGIFRQD